MNIGILLARGGSKGIKNKNLQMVDGDTLVGRCVDTMKSSGIFDLIIVSSDSDNILMVSTSHGATSHKRSNVNSQDMSTSEDALLEVFYNYQIKGGTAALIQCTTPLLRVDDLIAMEATFPHNTSTTLVSGYLESMHHWIHDGQNLQPINNSKNLRRSRQMDTFKVFVENGAAYFFDIANFLKTKNRFLANVLPYIMPKIRSIDIDAQLDLELVRKIIAIEKNSNDL